jgi:hypothetical protein
VRRILNAPFGSVEIRRQMKRELPGSSRRSRMNIP